MGKDDERNLGRKVDDRERRLNDIWTNLLFVESSVTLALNPDELSPLYRRSFPKKGSPEEEFALEIRGFRDEPYRLAHTIIVGIVKEGFVQEYSSAVYTFSEDGQITPHITHQFVRGNPKDQFNPEILGTIAGDRLRRLEREHIAGMA